AVPDIAGELVVIAAAAEETGAGIARHQVESEHAAIKGFCLPGIANLKMNMADDTIRGKAIPSGGAALPQKILRIERVRGHADAAVGAMPFPGRTIGIDLDSVAFRIGKIDRLA